MPPRRRIQSSDVDLRIPAARPRPVPHTGKRHAVELEKPRVAHFIRGWLLPAQTFIGNQILGLQRHTPIVLCHHRLNEDHPYPDVHIHPVVDSLTGWDRKIEAFSYRYLKTLTPRATQTMLETLRANSVQLLHIHFLVDARFLLPVIRGSRLPTIVSAYGYDVSSFPAKLFGVGLRYLRPLFFENITFLAMSEDMKRDMLAIGCPASKIKVHYYGTDADRFLNPERVYDEKNFYRILISGHLVATKGHHTVLDALKILRDDNTNSAVFQLVIVGDGPMMESLRSRVHALGLDDVVVFRGHVAHESKDLDDVYKNADLFALPSLTVDGEKEGIPGTLIEAMASGLPVVSTRHAGIPEVVTDNVNGILVEEGDAAGVAAALQRLAGDPSLRRRFGHAAMVKATKDLSLRDRTHELEMLYASLCSHNTGPLKQMTQEPL